MTINLKKNLRKKLKNNREKNNFPLEINNLETFEILLEILNENHENIYLDFSFIGTGVAKITKLNNLKLKEHKKINSRKIYFENFLFTLEKKLIIKIYIENFIKTISND